MLTILIQIFLVTAALLCWGDLLYRAYKERKDGRA